MLLTPERKEYWEEVMRNTSGDRTKMFAERKVDPDYAAHKEYVTVHEEMIEVPSTGVPVKCYITVPEERKCKKMVYINVHGGGWHGEWTDDDALYCAEIAHEVGCITVDVDYALTPDHAFPVPVEQIYETARWVKKKCPEWEADPDYMVIGGCSSGGNMAAAVTLLAAVRKDIKFRAQILDCAILDSATDPQCKPCGHEFMMDSQRGRGFSALYLGEDPASPYLPVCSPYFATDHMLSLQPSTLIITGGKCSFRFEDEEYGLRLARQGVEVTFRRFTKSQHAFNIRMKDEWREAHKLIVSFLKSQSEQS